ncbi:histidine--tRNA ligase [Mesorhizobium sp. YIM 152430]|uniref:histidine--tRNA ligase n=1 Tax=Mesorhizobium sp. YIM 152430 TaxID=3031761 RepID=UPI0023DC98FD|nr:histidine--tRNA ligase [Mesorhizobium sp. YIM 152430]MDF1601121.1 histidine--tRNA ligase [Mesorhizobium sp. YIM 152430]
MSSKAEKMKARLPRGFVDRHADDIRAVDAMTAKIREVYELYGFDPVEQPMIEYTDALGKFLPDQDRPNEGVFSFQDDDEQWLSLRYDLTAPLARFVAENFERLPKPYRSYRSGWVFRNEKPGPGRFRQFMQFDADIVGTPGVAADAEMAMMMADTLEAVGIKRGDYVIRYSDRRIWDGLLETIGLSSERNAGRRLTVLRAIDKLDRLGLEGVEELLGSGRKDPSGDFTVGAGLKDEQLSAVMSLLHGSEMDRMAYVDKVAFHGEGGKPPFHFKLAYSDDSVFMNNLRAIRDRFSINETFSEGLRSIEDIEYLVRANGYAANRIRIDGTVVRGLEYYTGPVYEAELTFDVTNEDGQVVRFGSVAGGGRYDGLVSRFRGEPVPATGFSIGVSRLVTALKNLGKLDAADVLAPVVVLVMDKDTESLGRYQKMVADLRAAGIRSEMYLGGAGMKAQMKYADRRGAPCVVIQGGDERAAGEVQIKDLIAGAKAAEGITDNTEWRESRPAQFSVRESGLVEAVRKVLDAQKADRG